MLSELGGVSLEALSLLATADLGGTDTHNTGVNTASYAVLLLDVDLGQTEVSSLESKVVFDVSLGRAVHQVAHLESLDGFVLGDESGAVVAADGLCKSLVLLASSVISSFDWHLKIITTVALSFISKKNQL